MIVVSNEPRTITIEGVDFIPTPKGIEIPIGKISKLKDNFFFKHYVSIGSFSVKEEVKQVKRISKEDK